MPCYACLLTSLDWLASVAVLDAVVLSVPAPFYKEKCILGDLFYYSVTIAASQFAYYSKLGLTFQFVEC